MDINNLKCQFACIAVGDAFFWSLDAYDRDDGSEGLLPSDSHISCDIVDEERPDQVAFPFPFLDHKSLLIKVRQTADPS